MRHTKEILAPVIRASSNWAQVASSLGLKPLTGSQAHLRKRAIAFDIDFSHFKTRYDWAKGLPSSKKKDLDHYLTEKSTGKSAYLRQRLIAEGRKKAVCENCGLDQWLGKSAPLELDHVNGDHFDNRIENLKILCPNCHAIKQPAVM